MEFSRKGNYSVELIRELPGCKVQSIFNFGKNNIDVKVDGKKILASNIGKMKSLQVAL